ncbi:OmpA family protein, partial [Candidatus Gracilibacteria bacterium]|nr:OmpA family protein [Candidatus Gracilibacteria bacterium]
SPFASSFPLPASRLPLLIIILISCFLINVAKISAQENLTADKAFQQMQYRTAIEKFRKDYARAKKGTPEKTRCAFMLGESYRLVNEPEKAEPFYSEVVQTTDTEKYPMARLYLADILRQKGNCNEAKVHYQKYLEKVPGNQAGEAGIRSCDLITQSSQVFTGYEIQPESYLNSTADDFAALFASPKADKVVFTSNRATATGKDLDNWTGEDFSDLFISTAQKERWATPVLVDERGLINTSANEGTPSFNAKFSTLYFTRCKMAEKEKQYCQIFRAAQRGSTWDKPELVMADSSGNSGQPWISPDELRIFFASNRQGGQGGKDIWMAERTDKRKPFDKPINLGAPVNTPGDEMFPYLLNDTVLYFASNSHPGFGGLDLFRSVLRNGAWSQPENLLPPMNGNKDDFAITFKDSDNEQGLFSSNREGGKGGDDIYSFKLKTLLFTLSGVVSDEKTKLPMKGVHVYLISEKGDSTLCMTDEKGSYRFGNESVHKDMSYDVLASYENYFNQIFSIETKSWRENHDFINDILLMAIPEKPIVLPEILWDLDKWDLKPQYQDSLQSLIKLLNDNPKIVIEMASHTDSRASDEYNNELSQKRAQAVVDYLVAKNIDRERLMAKGYGESIPRTLDADMTREGYTFKSGTVLTEKYILGLPSKPIQEAAHQLNRRTEFKVIAK